MVDFPFAVASWASHKARRLRRKLGFLQQPALIVPPRQKRS
jgi:hypothetical protein